MKLNNAIFKTLQRCNNVEKYDILISTSLFKMRHGYKDFKQYYIDKFKIWIEKIPRNAYVRLYVDATVIDDKDFLEIYDKQYKNLEIIFYQFNDYLEQDGEHHDGTFGSIVRFLPMYKEFRPNHIQYIWITDMDLSYKALSSKYLFNLKKNRALLSYFSKSCYDKPWARLDIKYPIFAGRIIMSAKIKLDINVFIKYLRDVRNGKYKYIYDAIVEKNKGKQREVKDVKYFPVGFDELFLNEFIYPIFSKYKRIIYFDISLSLFRDYLPKTEKKSFNKLFNVCQELDRPVSPKVRQEYIKMNEELYEQIRNTDLSQNKVLEYCRRDYEEHHDSFDVNEIGATSVIILN
jgi:hypothetical protein